MTYRQARRQASRPAHRNYYFWILCKSPENGKPFLIAGGDSEDEARVKALDNLGGLDFEIRRLPTRELGKASAIIRGTRLEDTHDLHTASQRLGHTKSLERMKSRFARQHRF